MRQCWDSGESQDLDSDHRVLQSKLTILPSPWHKTLACTNHTMTDGGDGKDPRDHTVVFRGDPRAKEEEMDPKCISSRFGDGD